ncbi:MAG: ferredoxin family protein [Chloroflexi bacterium]|nr:ferredoxin family protein [Chloroflexota bacterium]
MTYIITEPCVGVKDASCVAVCPVDCIYATDEDDQYFIHPDECIDCGACVPECPVNAIFAEDEVPDQFQAWIPVNHEYFKAERDEFYSKFRDLIAAAKEKNRDSEHANAELYNR